MSRKATRGDEPSHLGNLGPMGPGDLSRCLVYVLVYKHIYIYILYIYVYIVCESEVITWILSIPLDYVLVEVVDGDAEVSEAA